MLKILIVLSALASGLANAESKLFAEPLKPLAVTLTANFKLINTPNQSGAEIGRNDLGQGMIDAKYFESRGTMDYVDDAGQKISLTVDVQPRGMRRRQGCEYKPLDIDPKGKPTDDVFKDTHGSLEVVTHCEGGRYLRDLYNEYFNYRLKNAFGVPAFKVRLAKFTYVDTENKFSTITMPGIFLESKKDLGPRFGGKALKLTKNEEEAPATAAELSDARWSERYGDSFVPRMVQRMRIYKKYRALKDKVPLTMRQAFHETLSKALVANDDVFQGYLVNAFPIQYESGAVMMMDYDYDGARPNDGFSPSVLQAAYERLAVTLNYGDLETYKKRRAKADQINDRKELLAAIEETLVTFENSGLDEELRTFRENEFSLSEVKRVATFSTEQMKKALADPDQALSFLK